MTLCGGAATAPQEDWAIVSDCLFEREAQGISVTEDHSAAHLLNIFLSLKSPCCTVARRFDSVFVHRPGKHSLLRNLTRRAAVRLRSSHQAIP